MSSHIFRDLNFYQWVACASLDWELCFSSMAGVESGFEGVEPMVVGRQVAPDLIRGRPWSQAHFNCTFRPLENTIKIHNICDQIPNGGLDHEKCASDFLEHRIPAMEGYTLYIPITGQINFLQSSMQASQNLAPGQPWLEQVPHPLFTSAYKSEGTDCKE